MADIQVTDLNNPPFPIFVVFAKDALAVPTMEEYRYECEKHGLKRQVGFVEQAIEEVRQWQERNIKHTKLPDHQHRPFQGSFIYEENTA